MCVLTGLRVQSLLKFISLLFAFILMIFFSIDLAQAQDQLNANSLQLCSRLFNASQIDESLLGSTAGIEFEGSVPRHLNFSDLAKAIESDLKIKNPNDDVWIEEEPFSSIESSYHVKHKKNGWVYTYSVKVEGNIVSERRYEPEVKGVEITSPIMRTEHEVLYFIDLLNDLRNLGLKSRPDRGGIHIHWGVRPTETLSSVSALYKVVYKLIRATLDHFPLGEERREFLDILTFRSIVDNFAKTAGENPEVELSEGDISQISKRSVLRYEKRYNTIETRIFNSTLNPNLNHFYFRFTRAIFEAWKYEEEYELWSYLVETESLSFERVIEIMGFETEQVMGMLEEATEKLNELEEQIVSRKRNQLPSQYVMASRIEQLVDQFWEHEHNSQSLGQAIRDFRNEASESQVQIGLFNILQHPNLRTLSESLRRQLFLDLRELFDLDHFVSREIWAIEVALRRDIDLLGAIIVQLDVSKSEVILPLIRWLFYRFSDPNFDIQGLVESLSLTPGAIDQMLYLTERHMLIKRPIQRDHQFELLATLIERSNKPLNSLRAMNILKYYRGDFLNSRINLTPLFDAILKKSRRSHQVFVELITYINNLKLRGKRETEDVSNPKELIKTAEALIKNGNFPRIYGALVTYVGYHEGLFSDSQMSSLITALASALTRMQVGLTEEEISSLKTTLRMSFLKNSELSGAAHLLEQIESL